MAAEEKDKKDNKEDAENKSSASESTSSEPDSTKKDASDSSAQDKPKENISSFSLLDSDKPAPGKTGNDAADAQHNETPKKEQTEQPKQDKSMLDEKDGKQISSDEVKDWLKDVRPDTTKEQEKGGGRPIFKWLAVFMILLLIAGAVAGGIYYYRQNVPAGEVEETPQEDQQQKDNEGQMEEEPTPTPTPDEEVDLTSYSINVLNGSGVAGQAGAVADLLTEAGFSDPDTGNAEEFNYTVTEIQVKENVPQEVVDRLTSSLEDSYTTNVLEENLAEDAEYDVIVTVGEQN